MNWETTEWWRSINKGERLTTQHWREGKEANSEWCARRDEYIWVLTEGEFGNFTSIAGEENEMVQDLEDVKELGKEMEQISEQNDEAFEEKKSEQES